jgi:Flp pilus assembly protein CpaB
MISTKGTRLKELPLLPRLDRRSDVFNLDQVEKERKQGVWKEKVTASASTELTDHEIQKLQQARIAAVHVVLLSIRPAFEMKCKSIPKHPHPRYRTPSNEVFRLYASEP